MVITKSVCIGYEKRQIVTDFSFKFTEGKIHTIIGPNGSGKSTVFKALSRLVHHHSGDILLKEACIKSYHNRSIAQIMAVLSQTNQAPTDFTVRDLIRFGRSPHKRMFESMNQEDEKIVDWAIEMTRMEALEHRRMTCLSGGERQRAWIAMNLAQQPQILLLDEPTTYLDIQHQFEVMELIKELNQRLNITVVMILHDLNQASLYSDEIIVIKEGCIVCHGTPQEVMNQEVIKSVYNVNVSIFPHTSGKPMVMPVGI